MFDYFWVDFCGSTYVSRDNDFFWTMQGVDEGCIVSMWYVCELMEAGKGAVDKGVYPNCVTVFMFETVGSIVSSVNRTTKSKSEST